jgi:hypothetical protein
MNFRTLWNIGINTNIQANSNRPYNITTGLDENGDTNTNESSCRNGIQALDRGIST